MHEKTESVKIDKELMDGVRKIASREGRSIKMQLERLIKGIDKTAELTDL